jgi:flagellar hook-basal body complex protein FliE
MADISSIGSFAKPSIGGAGPKLTPIEEPLGDFGSALKDAVASLGELGAKADANALKLATGESVDIHEVMLSMEQASLGFQTALQVRNKLVDAYQEIMRMSV